MNTRYLFTKLYLVLNFLLIVATSNGYIKELKTPEAWFYFGLIFVVETIESQETL